jgi:hypothetical protein
MEYIRFKTMSGNNLPCWLCYVDADRNCDCNTEEQDRIHLRPDQILT